MSTSVHDVPALLDAEAAATYLCVSEAWVREAARDGRLPSVKLGTATRASLRFRRVALDEWIAQHERAPKPPTPRRRRRRTPTTGAA